MSVAKTEIVCDVREQVKLTASAHLGLERGLNCIETVHYINSEDHKGVSGKDRWYLIEIQCSCQAQIRYMVDYQMII